MHSFKVNSISRKRFIGSLLSFISVPFIPKTWGSPQEGYFKHGVASGDPQQDRVIIWTRVSPPNTSEAVVVWEVATDSNFRKLVKKGKFSTSEARDFTVKIDVTGLEAGKLYYYRFSYKNEYSRVGMTRTLPKELKGGAFHIAVVSCSDWESGYFSAYRHIARKEEVDLVLHLGDYIYEYETGRRDNGLSDRTFLPRHEIVTLDDYRQRYAQYRTDPDLQLLHATKPFCLVWDDHEIANDAFQMGAQNHQSETEGPWEDRRNAAIQAYFEWLPVRGNKPSDLIRKLSVGEELELFLLDQRLTGRTAQLSVNDVDFYQEERSLLGREQFEWLEDNLKDSQAKWKLIANQVPFAGYKPNKDGLPNYRDKWLGYPHDHQRLLRLLKENRSGNTVFLTGDHHRAFVMAVHDEPNPMQYTKPWAYKPLAWELLTPSITARNDDFRTKVEIQAREAAILDTEVNPHVMFCDIKSHGYYVARIEANAFKATYFFMEDIRNPRSEERRIASFEMNGKDFMLRRT